MSLKTIARQPSLESLSSTVSNGDKDSAMLVVDPPRSQIDLENLRSSLLNFKKDYRDMLCLHQFEVKRGVGREGDSVKLTKAKKKLEEAINAISVFSEETPLEDIPDAARTVKSKLKTAIEGIDRKQKSEHRKIDGFETLKHHEAKISESLNSYRNNNLAEEILSVF